MIRVACIVLCRLLRFSALSHWCGRALRVHFSLHCACGVPTGESDLAAVSSGSSQRAVRHGFVVHIMFLLLAVPISLGAFRDFAKQLRTCAQPLSVCFWYLEAALFVMGSVSARLNGTDVLVYTSTSHCRAYHESGACLQERCFRSVRSPWQKRNGVQLCLLCA